MKILNSVFLAFMTALALQSANAQYVNAEDEDELIFPMGNKKGKDGALFERTDSDEVKIQKVRAYCESQRQYRLASGVSPCEVSRSVSEFIDVVNDSMPSLKNVYREYFKIKPGFSGKVTLKFAIAASGEITDISIKSSTTNYPEFNEAIKNAVATWKWKPVKKWRLKVLHPGNNGDYKNVVSFRFKEEMLK
jgi:TonB family protein